MKKALLLAPMVSVHERFNIANISVLKQIGVEIHLAANFSMDKHCVEYAKIISRQGIVIHDIPFARASLKNNFNCIAQIRKLLVTEKFDLVHCHTETGGILTRISSGVAPESKYIYTPHGMSFYKGSSIKSQMVYRPIEKWICSRMDINIAMNAEELEVLKGWNASKAFFVHGVGIELDKYQNSKVDIAEKRKSFGIPEEAFLMLAVGELNENKNHKIILESMEMLKDDENLYLLICGEGALRNALLNQADIYGIKNRVILAGFRYDMQEIFPIANCLIFPSYHEGLPVSVMQAMAAGLPVICSKIRGNTDLIKTNGGILCNPNSSEDFRNAIIKLKNDESLRNMMSKTNRCNSVKYSLVNVRNELENIYRKVL